MRRLQIRQVSEHEAVSGIKVDDETIDRVSFDLPEGKKCTFFVVKSDLVEAKDLAALGEALKTAFQGQLGSGVRIPIVAIGSEDSFEVYELDE
jgi:hypothetical protein